MKSSRILSKMGTQKFLSETVYLIQQIEAIKKQQDLDRGVPVAWQDFAPLTRIKSGSGFCKFVPYDYQTAIANLIEQHSYLLIVKGRQLGCSETLISVALHKAIASSGKSCLIISKTIQDTFSLAKRVREMILSLSGLKLINDSLSEMRFENGSVIYFRAGEQAGRGLPSCEFIVFDEFAFYKENIDELAWAAALPSTEMLDGAEKVIIISTPNGRQNLFYKYLVEGNGDKDIMQLIQEVRDGEHITPPHIIDSAGWVKLILHYTHHPIYSLRKNYLEWIRKRKKIPLSKVLREYDLDFSEGESTWIDEDMVLALCTGTWKTESDREHKYYCGLDAATTGNDYLVFLVLEKFLDGKLSVVAMHRGRKSNFDRHIKKIKRLVDIFGPVHGCVEVNGVGRLYYERFMTEFTGTQWHEVKTTATSRPLMVDKLAIALENGDVTFPAGIIADEILSLEDVDGYVAAAPGKHDDTVFALIFALLASEKDSAWDLSNYG